MTTSRDRLLDTLYDMARFDGSVRERLVNAYRENALLVREEHLPADVRDEFKKLHARVTAIHSEALGSVQASVNAMTDDQVRETVDQLYGICCSLLRRD